MKNNLKLNLKKIFKLHSIKLMRKNKQKIKKQPRIAKKNQQKNKIKWLMRVISKKSPKSRIMEKNKNQGKIYPVKTKLNSKKMIHCHILVTQLRNGLRSSIVRILKKGVQIIRIMTQQLYTYLNHNGQIFQPQ